MIGIEQAITAGYAAFKRADYVSARGHLTGVEHPQAVHLLGLVEKGAGNYQEAAKLLARAAVLDPNNHEIANNQGLLGRLTDDLHFAEAAFRRALALNPDFRGARLDLGRTLHDMALYHDAMTELSALIARDSTDVAALVAYANAAMEIKERKIAREYIGRALAMDPSHIGARYSNGVFQLETDDLLTAETTFSALREDGQDGPEIQYMFARIELENGKILKAQSYAKLAYQKMPTDKYLRLLADLYWMNGDEADFHRLMDMAVKLPKLAITAIGLIRQSGHPEAALDQLAQQPSIVLDSVAGQALKSGLLLKLGDARGAVEAGRVADEYDASTKVNFNLVNALLAIGETHEAMGLIKAARVEEPLSQFWLAYEATVLRLLGNARYGDLIDYDRHVRTYQLPTPEGFTSLENFNESFLEVLGKMNLFDTHPLNQSLRGGGQAPNDLTVSRHPAVQAYFKALDGPIRDYMTELGQSDAHPSSERNTGQYKFSGGWSVRLGSGGHHINHIHPRGWISSSYYVSVPPETTSKHGKAGWIKFGEPPIATQPVLGPEKWIQPKAGMLVLFPSFLWHGTEPINDGSVRVTAPFDVVPV